MAESATVIVQVCTRIPSELALELQALADKEKRSMSAQIAVILEAYFTTKQGE